MTVPHTHPLPWARGAVVSVAGASEPPDGTIRVNVRLVDDDRTSTRAARLEAAPPSVVAAMASANELLLAYQAGLRKAEEQAKERK